MNTTRKPTPWDKGVVIGAALALVPVAVAMVLDKAAARKEAQRERERAVDQIEEDLRVMTEKRHKRDS